MSLERSKDRAGHLTPYDFQALGAAMEKAGEQASAVTLDTDILAAALSPAGEAVLFRVMVAMDTAGVFRVTITKDGDTETLDLNRGSGLAAGALYIFDHLVHSGDTVNYQYSASAVLKVLRVQEIPIAAQ